MDKATLKAGSDLWTDGWAAYKGLDRFGYRHHVVNHSKEFKSADGTCTNGVEGYRVLKSKLLAEHIDEFMYHQHFRGDTPFKFRTLIAHIKERYTF
ncbi:DNA ligase [Frankliniella fusca]|uniref:DNA ligase n=1 Tax=Frankliniella fusca TaxID=407009 RepID=A0AAE1LPB3_9NEOP|nr:DNA ligase [Frankliniella fusca]